MKSFLSTRMLKHSPNAQCGSRKKKKKKIRGVLKLFLLLWCALSNGLFCSISVLFVCDRGWGKRVLFQLPLLRVHAPAGLCPSTLYLQPSRTSPLEGPEGEPRVDHKTRFEDFGVLPCFLFLQMTPLLSGEA